jgi:hypothetical protein
MSYNALAGRVPDPAASCRPLLRVIAAHASALDARTHHETHAHRSTLDHTFANAALDLGAPRRVVSRGLR